MFLNLLYRYCCHHLWGEPAKVSISGRAGENATSTPPPDIGPDDVVVDPPDRRTIFDECEWKNFMSASNGHRVSVMYSTILSHTHK